MSTFQRFDRNTHGRDFVVGDVHGCFDQLHAAVDRRGFDPERDRLFAVGDLIDRGPQSPEALEWLDRPWFHSCLGNHEEMLLKADHPDDLFVWMLNGGGWWMEQDEDTRERFRHAAARLPLAMEVDASQGRVGIVHADVPAAMSWPAFIEALEADDREARFVAVWGRARAEGMIRSGVEGIDRVVCGHTIMPDGQVHTVGNVWCIDTGAFLPLERGRLTLLTLDELFSA